MVYNAVSFSHALPLYYIIIFTVINLEKMQNCIFYTNIIDIRKWFSSYSLYLQTLVKIMHYYQTSHYQIVFILLLLSLFYDTNSDAPGP